MISTNSGILSGYSEEQGKERSRLSLVREQERLLREVNVGAASQGMARRERAGGED